MSRVLRDGRVRRVVSVVGTRPEAIKMAPLAQALATRPGIEHRVVLTGQHKDLAPVFGALAPEAVRQLAFNPVKRSDSGLREALHRLLCGAFAGVPADLVLVHGDTATAVAGAFAARDCGIPIGHVEAGLRSGNFKQPWPEEGNRVVIDALADLLFAPTEAAAENLRREPRVGGRIMVTGNTGIDALFSARGAAARVSAVHQESGLKTIVVTCHRKENQGGPVQAVCAALKRLARSQAVEIVLPLPMNRHARKPLEEALAGEPRIRLVEPLGYEDMVQLMDRSWLILTDSGGLQEEGAALGKPVFVLRSVTERPEGMATNNLLLVGTDEETIVAAVSGLLRDPVQYERMSRPSLAFGDGRAAPRIADAIQGWLEASRLRA
ncbi:MAG TPA: UDP-N-acetylglucosamine 2-epimerase (non-hydrolyzing) [Allosphingosinicella sp.]|jgi:UDP-N-acetylglucosamine 2-epimerase (non-hydrolysing)